jgi:hypothetical protein
MVALRGLLAPRGAHQGSTTLLVQFESLRWVRQKSSGDTQRTNLNRAEKLLPSRVPPKSTFARSSISFAT